MSLWNAVRRKKRQSMLRRYRPVVWLLEDRVVPGFLAPLSADAGNSPDAVAVGDFNGDGIPDLAVANETGSNVSVLLGNGDGTFRPPVNFAVGSFASSVATEDFNGDGTLDLAVAVGNGVSVLSMASRTTATCWTSMVATRRSTCRTRGP